MGDHKHKKEKKSSKRQHRDSSSNRDHKKHKKNSFSRCKAAHEDEIDYSDPSLWVEAKGSTSEITPADYLRSQQKANDAKEQESDVADIPKEQDARHGWMLDGALDFSAMGSARIKEEDKTKPNPDFVSNRIIHFQCGCTY